MYFVTYLRCAYDVVSEIAKSIAILKLEAVSKIAPIPCSPWSDTQALDRTFFWGKERERVLCSLGYAHVLFSIYMWSSFHGYLVWFTATSSALFTVENSCLILGPGNIETYSVSKMTSGQAVWTESLGMLKHCRWSPLISTVWGSTYLKLQKFYFGSMHSPFIEHTEVHIHNPYWRSLYFTYLYSGLWLKSSILQRNKYWIISTSILGKEIIFIQWE